MHDGSSSTSSTKMISSEPDLKLSAFCRNRKVMLVNLRVFRLEAHDDESDDDKDTNGDSG